MDETQNSQVERAKKIEKMLSFIHGGLLFYACMFIETAWREFYELYVSGELAAEGLLKLSLYQYMYRLGIVMRILGGFLFIFNHYFGPLLMLIYQAILCPILYYLFNSRMVQFRESVQDYLQIVQKLCERGGRVHRQLYDDMSMYVNNTMSLDEGVATSYSHFKFKEETYHHDICNHINIKEIERMVISSHILAPSKTMKWSEFNKLFMEFIKGVGIIALLVFFIVMKHKWSSMKRNTN